MSGSVCVCFRSVFMQAVCLYDCFENDCFVLLLFRLFLTFL